MAKRQALRRIDSSEVMGEGSYVEARAILYGEAKRAYKGNQDESVEKDDLVLDLIANSLIEWDWVDFDGSEMQLPKNGAELGKMLTVGEVQFLTEELVGSLERQKNLDSGSPTTSMPESESHQQSGSSTV